MADTAIEWTHRPGTIGAVWNPTTGCDRISPGCDLCYALTMARRLKAMGSAKYQTDGDPRTSGPGFGVATHPGALREPLRWRRPRTVFVNSMSDLFHARVPVEFIAQVWAVMAATPQHTYQILTKRPERMARLLGDEVTGGQPLLETLTDEAAAQALYDAPWPLPNVWLGTSVESIGYLRRVDDLRQTPAAVRFVSAEPLLRPLAPSIMPGIGRLGIDLAGIDWLIVGGESGPGARPCDPQWIRDLIDACRAAGTAPYVKQLGSYWAALVGGRSKGGDWTQWPIDLRVREYPA